MKITRQDLVQALLDEGVELVRVADGSFWLGVKPPPPLPEDPRDPQRLAEQRRRWGNLISELARKLDAREALDKVTRERYPGVDA